VRQGQLFVLSAPSGAGKTSIARKLRALHPELRESISYTTRRPRPGEVDGRDYHFVSDEEFDRMIAEGLFAEWAHVYGHRSGTGRLDLERLRADGGDVLLDVDTQGGASIKRMFPEAHLIFVLPPSLEELEKRLIGRGTESPELLERRLEEAGLEFARVEEYDFAVVNDDLDAAVEKVSAVIVAMRCRRSVIWEEVKDRFADLKKYSRRRERGER